MERPGSCRAGKAASGARDVAAVASNVRSGDNAGAVNRAGNAIHAAGADNDCKDKTVTHTCHVLSSSGGKLTHMRQVHSLLPQAGHVITGDTFLGCMARSKRNKKLGAVAASLACSRCLESLGAYCLAAGRADCVQALQRRVWRRFGSELGGHGRRQLLHGQGRQQDGCRARLPGATSTAARY